VLVSTSSGSSFNPVFMTADLGVSIKDKLGPKTQEVGSSAKGAANDFKDSSRSVSNTGDHWGCFPEWAVLH
jgi:hypothetical protein